VRHVRKGEPDVVEIVIRCQDCKSEVIHGRKWWRKHIKGYNDAHGYRVINSYVCRICQDRRQAELESGRRISAEGDRQALAQVEAFYRSLGLGRDGFGTP
jgi:hypothetical protein